MSHSGSSDEFSYQTRLVVYNFFGLVPATPQSDDELENYQNEALLDEKSRASRSNALEDLPTMSLIDRLSESEVRQMQMKMVCSEVADKVRLVEPASSSASESSSKPTDVLYETVKKYRAVSNERYDHEVAHQALLNELRQVVVTRGVSPLSAGNEEASSAPITVIQKRNRLKILGDGITASEEADIYRHLPLQPFAASAKLYDVPSSYSAANSQPLPGAVGGSGIRSFIPRRPTTLLTSSGLTSSRETLRQIDEDHELNTVSGASAEDVLFGRDRDITVTTPIQNSALRGPTTPVSVERQSSTLSSSSRRRSTYVDITEVDIENLVKTKALPPVTLPLKRELSVAFEELEKTHKTDDFDEVDFAEGTEDNDDVSDMNAARSPESEVADSLRALGDRIQDEYGAQLSLLVWDILSAVPEQPVNYAALQNAASQLLHETQNGWTQATLVMLLGQRVIYELLKKGYSGISHVAELTAELVEDHAADFIINNGGWNSISDIGVETVTVSTPLDADSRLSQEFDSNFPHVELSSVKDVRNCELSDIRTPDKAAAIENSPLPLPLDSPCLRMTEDNSSSSETVNEFVSAGANPGSPGNLPPLSPADVVQPKNDGMEGEILRQNSRHYADEMDAVQSWSQPAAFAGFVFMTVLISWILYRRLRRTT